MNSIYRKNHTFIEKLKNKLTYFSFFKKKQKSQEIDKKLVYSLSSSNIPSKQQIKHIGRYLNKFEKNIIRILVVLLLLSLIYVLYFLYNKNFESIPSSGGVYTEGAVGFPRLINPLYSDDRDIDSDLAYLIYSRLFTYDSYGNLVNDLVSDWQVSDDYLEYHIELKRDIKWHNSFELNADDVLFTFYLMKNPSFRSNWQSALVGVELEKIDDYNIKFILQEAYAPFLNLLTFGIMPRFAWENASVDSILLSDLNLRPIGSGPYQFESLLKNDRGEIKEYSLSINPYYYDKQPYISNLVFKFYHNYNELINALNSKQVDGIAYLPFNLKERLMSKHRLFLNYLDLPQVTGLFFNQNNELLKEIKIREALSLLVDREILLKDYLARLSEGPLPISNFAYNQNLELAEYNIEKAIELLEELSWQRYDYNFLSSDSLTKETIDSIRDDQQYWFLLDDKILSFKLSTPLLDENILLANLIAQQLEDIGIRVELEFLTLAQMQDKVLKNKDFEILLNTQIIGSDPDISSFWHSSQINGGLNFISYKNTEVDSLLLEARKQVNDQEARIEKYHKIQELIVKDKPAIFLFSPQYLYIIDQKIKGYYGQSIISPRHRFASISDWYIKTKRIFTR